QEGINGALAPADDLDGLLAAVQRAQRVPRQSCRRWVERHGSREAFAARWEQWLQAGCESWTRGR
ncbi:MAG: hypothetical protein ACKOCI_04340, partial [Cyanobium sp.]